MLGFTGLKRRRWNAKICCTIASVVCCEFLSTLLQIVTAMFCCCYGADVSVLSLIIITSVEHLFARRFFNEVTSCVDLRIDG
jgi:hypothetical protein